MLLMRTCCCLTISLTDHAGAQTGAATVMIAERGAAMIQGKDATYANHSSKQAVLEELVTA